jgi:hypothetical protein
MSVNVAYDLWSELKRFMSSVDREEAADTLVNVLIDNDYDAEEIRSAFKGDNDVKRALQSYLDDAEEEDSEEYDEDVDSDDY